MGRYLRIAVVAASLAGLLACAAAAEPRPEPQQPVAKELAAAAERWKIERAAERAGQPGAAGQHDLFWEILRLWEKDEKARADADLLAIADWLLFSAGLWTDPNLADPVYAKVPVLAPRLGEKLLDKRLAGWIAAVQGGPTGMEPWSWPEFPALDKKALAAAVSRLARTGPRNNPLARFWTAAALLAAEGEKGPEEFSAARAALEKDLPSRAGQTYVAALNSLSGAGVRAALPMLLDQAEADLAATKTAPETARYRESYGYSERGGLWALTRFYQLVGWSQRALTSGRADLKAELAKARAWLKDNLARLVWDPKLRRFTGGAPQPGMEKLLAAAAAEKKWGLNILDRLTAGQINHPMAVNELLGLMDGKPEAAKDPAVGELLIAVVEDGGRNALVIGDRDPVCARLSRISPELASRFLEAAIRGALAARDPAHLEGFLRDPNASDPKAVAQAFAQMAPEYEKSWAEAAKSGDGEKALYAAMACLFVGGKVDRKELAELVARAPASPGYYSRDSLLGRWAGSMVRAGRTGGLRLLLALGRKEIGKYAAEGAMHPIRQFEQYAGWRDQGEAPPGSAEEELAKAEAWLDKYEPALKWDQKKQRFNGAPPPGLENLAASAEAVARRYGLKLGDASGGGLDEVRRLFSELIELLERNPEAGKDAQLGELILALVGPGRLEQDQLLRERLLVKLPRLHRAAGVGVWTECIRRALVQASAVQGGYSSFPSELTSQRLRGLDRSILPEACKPLGAEFTARYAASSDKKAEERLPLALACLYAGGKVEMAEIERLLAEAGKIGTPRISLRSWAEGLVDAGNPAGLRVLLLSAGSFPQSRAHDLTGFEYLAGRSQDRFGGRMFELDEKALLARIEAARKWLDDNQKNLIFDPDKGRFRLKTVQNPDPAKPPAEEVF